VEIFICFSSWGSSPVKSDAEAEASAELSAGAAASPPAVAAGAAQPASADTVIAIPIKQAINFFFIKTIPPFVKCFVNLFFIVNKEILHQISITIIIL
jgi:hypothetical protein